MGRTAPSVLPPGSLEEIFAIVAELSDDEFASLQSAVQSPEAFEADKERSEELAARLGNSPERVGFLLGAISFLYQRATKSEAVGTSRELLIRRFVEGFKEDIVSESERELLANRLIILTEPNDLIERARKARRLRTGFIPNGMGFSSFVDLRPDFDESYSEMRGLVPIVQFRVTTDSDDPSIRNIVFQLDEKRLKSLKSAVADAEMKLRTLSETGPLIGLIQLFDARKPHDDDT